MGGPEDELTTLKSPPPAKPDQRVPVDEGIETPAPEDRDATARERPGEAVLKRERTEALGTDTEPGGDLPTADLRPSTPRMSLTLPGFRVIGILGQGGMGTVYEAEQLEPRRRVAIKVLHARSSNALVRFKTEAQIMARLDHPGIARVLQSGESSDQQPYLVMEYVDGEVFDDYAEDLPLERKLGLFAQVCDAVHHAHLKGVIHRDLKPSNIMVRDGDRIVVLDFGIARLAEDDGSTPGATIAGEILGTPIYMSPEQARLRADEVDARSDVYTLGVILYELVSGELPYNVRKLPMHRVADVICDAPPVPLGTRVPAMRGDLSAIVAKTLAKRPEERYLSVAALAEDVRRFAEGKSVSVRTPSPIERVRRFIRRRPVAALVIATIALSLAAFIGVVTTLWLSARTARREAEVAHGRAANAHQRAETARADLEVRTNQLTLRQARSALARDPTEALAWLVTLSPTAVDAGTAWAIADEAIARGVATHVIRAHVDQVHRVEPLGDGFVTAGYDSKAIVWGGTPIAGRATILLKRGRVHVARPSPDGTRLAIAGDDGELVVASPDGRVLAELVGHAGSVQDVAWSSDGAWLATGDDHGNLMLWPKGEPAGKKLVTGTKGISALAFSDTGKDLIAGDHAGQLWMFDVDTGARSAAPGSGTSGELVAAWSNGTEIATVDGEGLVARWRPTSTGLQQIHGVATNQKIKRAAFARGATWVVLGGVGGALLRVEGDRVTTLANHDAQVRTLAISADLRWIAVGTDDGTLELRDQVSGRVLALQGHRGRIRHVSFTSDGTTLLSSDSDGVVRRWAIGNEARTLLAAGGSPMVLVAAAPSGEQFAGVAADGAVVRWSLATGEHVQLGTSEARITHLATAGGVVITGTAEGTISWWGGAAPKQTRVAGTVKGIALVGDRIAISTSKGPISMFTLEGAPLPALAGHAGGSDALAFNADDTVLASGGQDRKVRVWRRSDTIYDATELDGGLRGDTRFVAFSPDGRLLVVAGNDGQVVGWTLDGSLVDPRSMRVLARHTGAVTALAFDRRGTWLVTAGRDGSLVRITVDGSVPVETTRLANAAIGLAFDGNGGVHAVTYAGAVERWSAGERTAPVVEIDHGIRGALGLSMGRWVLAFDDGAVLITERSDRPLADLPAMLARATTYRLTP